MSGFKKGELLVSSKPYAYTLREQYRGRFCDNCFTQNHDLKRCSQCSTLYFCDKTCQKNAWNFHKNECKYLKSMPWSGQPSDSLRLLALILLKVKKCGKEEPYEEVHGRKVSFSTLMSHAEEIKKDVKKYSIMLGMLGALNQWLEKENIPDVEEFIEIFGKMSINTYTIDLEGARSIGHGLYLGCSVFDHSCDFDAINVFDGLTLNVRMVKDVPHRDIRKVYISYIDTLKSTEIRQEMLRDQYYFTCQCSFCTTHKLDEMRTELLDDSSETKAKALKCKQDLEVIQSMVADRYADAAVVQKLCLKALKDQSEVMPNTNLCRVTTAAIAVEMSILIEEYSDAVAVGALLEEPYRLYYGHFHDAFGLFLFKIGKVLLLLNKPNEAVHKLTEAEVILKITHGEQHSMYKILQANLQEARLGALIL